MNASLDILTVARWAIATYGAEAIPIIRRRAAENLLADDPEAAQCWKLVAEVASQALAANQMH